MDPDVQTPLDSPNTPSPSDDKDIKKAIPTLEFQTVGSDVIGQVSKFSSLFFYFLYSK